MNPICGYSTAIEGWIGTVIDKFADGSEQKMTHTVYRGWYNASLGVLLANGRINRIDKSCCGAGGMDSIHRGKDQKDDTRRMCMIPSNKSNWSTILQYSTRICFTGSMQSDGSVGR